LSVDFSNKPGIGASHLTFHLIVSDIRGISDFPAKAFAATSHTPNNPTSHAIHRKVFFLFSLLNILLPNCIKRNTHNVPHTATVHIFNLFFCSGVIFVFSSINLSISHKKPVPLSATNFLSFFNLSFKSI
jgi:hypothetical protein